MSFPDPSLTANLYCAGRLDKVLYHGVLPAWRCFADSDPEQQCYLWLLRYPRGGEHLKVRFHGPENKAACLRELLEGKVEAFLAGLPTFPNASQHSRPQSPAIDQEDQVQIDHPDRTLLWTHYRRSYISLGAEAFFVDDAYTALCTLCHGAACDLVLAAFEAQGSADLPHGRRQSVLLQALLVAFQALGMSAETRADYLAYHRDWTLGYLVLKQNSDSKKAERVLESVDAQVQALGGQRTSLQRALASSRVRESGALERTWGDRLGALEAAIRPLCNDPNYHADPHAKDAAFPTYFKIFQGLASQLGLNLLDEGFTYHLLLSAESDDRAITAKEHYGAQLGEAVV